MQTMKQCIHTCTCIWGSSLPRSLIFYSLSLSLYTFPSATFQFSWPVSFARSSDISRNTACASSHLSFRFLLSSLLLALQTLPLNAFASSSIHWKIFKKLILALSIYFCVTISGGRGYKASTSLVASYSCFFLLLFQGISSLQASIWLSILKAIW